MIYFIFQNCLKMYCILYTWVIGQTYRLLFYGNACCLSSSNINVLIIYLISHRCSFADRLYVHIQASFLCSPMPTLSATFLPSSSSCVHVWVPGIYKPPGTMLWPSMITDLQIMLSSWLSFWGTSQPRDLDYTLLLCTYFLLSLLTSAMQSSKIVHLSFQRFIPDSEKLLLFTCPITGRLSNYS